MKMILLTQAVTVMVNLVKLKVIMVNVKYKCVYTLLLIFFVSACTTTAEIDYSRTSYIESLSDNFSAVTITGGKSSFNNTRSSDGYYLVELKSQSNLEKIIVDKEMAFLYYRLYRCSEGEVEQEFYVSSAVQKSDATLSSQPGFYYYAPIPTDFIEFHNMPNRFLPNKEVNVDANTSICIGLGAGNMLGQALKTNLVKLPTLSEVK